jgi:hypothetical protein
LQADDFKIESAVRRAVRWTWDGRDRSGGWDAGVDIPAAFDRVDGMKPRVSSIFVSTQGAFQLPSNRQRGPLGPPPRALTEILAPEWTTAGAAVRLTLLYHTPCAGTVQTAPLQTARADPPSA